MAERDNTPIFGAEAARHYAAGLPVIPLFYHDKMPVPKGWSKFHDQLPGTEEQEAWIANYSNCNMGLVMGQQSGIMAIDIDTDDEAIKKVIFDVLSSISQISPWQRVGRKGMVLAYKYNGTKTFRIKTAESMLVECLSSRTQIVLPPSIHPDTQRPYEANCDLVSVLDKLPTLPIEFETILRQALQEHGVELSTSGWTRTTDFVSIGARDTQMTRIAGLLAGGIGRGELPLREAIDRLYAWKDLCSERTPGDDIDIEKGVQNLVKFLIRDVLERGRMLPQGWDDGLSEEDKEKLGVQFNEDHEEWDYEQIKKYLLEEFETHAADTPGRAKAINYALTKLVHSPSMDKLDEERLIKYIQETSGSRVTIHALRARIREMRSGGLKGLDHAEIAKAVLKVLSDVSEHRYHHDFLWRWGGSNWEKVDDSELLKMIANDYGHYPKAQRHSDHHGILKTVKVLASKELKTKSVVGVNFVNGFLTEDGELLEHDPDFGMIYTLPFRYLPELSGKAFRFADFLYQSWGDDPDFEEKKAALQEAMCVTLFGQGPKYERVICLHGVAGSGKSQMLKLVSCLVPEEARSAVNPADWGDKFAPADMAGKLLNLCGELSEKKRIDGSRFKQIVSGEEIQAQYKNMNHFNMRPIATHWFATNHLPRTDDTSEGFNRRWLVLHFPKKVAKEDKIVDLGPILVAEEREAIVAWAVEAMARLQRNRDYTLPSGHLQLVNEIANLNNSVRFFLTESGKVKFGARSSNPTSESELHNAYWSFCLGAGVARPVTLKAFRQQMRELKSELDFDITFHTSPEGGEVAVYSNLTLAGKMAA